MSYKVMKKVTRQSRLDIPSLDASYHVPKEGSGHLVQVSGVWKKERKVEMKIRLFLHLELEKFVNLVLSRRRNQ